MSRPPEHAHRQEWPRLPFDIRVHDLKHKFRRRLRSGSLETRSALVGHKNGDITTHYSAPELQELVDAVERVYDRLTQGQGCF